METLEYKNCWLDIDKLKINDINQFCENYKHFLNIGKTERQCVNAIVKEATQQGFRPFEDFKQLNPGDKTYFINRNKNLITH
ncbi:hypothetical protein V4D06_18710 [Vibrio mimicus]|uniref:hypothetical protein n=1 Tax=Vibrio mimicus TaxID=674 RepID=UPI002F91EA92